MNIRTVMLPLALMMPVSLLAQTVPPADNIVSINETFDRAAPPASIPVWTRATGGYAVGAPTWSGAIWTCKSTTDASVGACATQPVWGGSATAGQIRLRFIERRSRLPMELSLLAFSERHFTGGGGVGCSFGVRNIQNAVTAVCNGVTNNGKWLTVSLPQAELAKIPSGGIWTARLELNERLWGGAHPVVAAFNADIELSVTDDGNIQLYLPAFGNAEPRVDLNLRAQPLSGAGGTGMVSGRSVIDACLYDGYNSNSNTFITRISDPLSTNGDYSVRHVASVGDDAHNRITYRVVTQTANQGAIERRSDVPLSQNGMHMADIRAVRLPGVPYPVVCTPFPIQLITDPFPQNSKAAGHYSGTLKVEFTPSTTAP